MSCKAPGLVESESSIELTHCSTSASLDEEATSELNLDEAYDQLEMMKQRVLELKSMIIRPVPPPTTTTDPVQSEFEMPADSENVKLRDIQQDTLNAFQSIGQMRSRLKETTKELELLNARIQESVRCTTKLSKNLDEVPQWMEELKHQTGLCLERHNALDTTCCSYLEYSNHMRPLLQTLQNQLVSKVSVRCYKMDYKQVSEYVIGTRRLLNRTRHDLLKFTHYLQKSLKKPLTNAAHLLPDLVDLLALLEKSEHIKPPKRASFQVKSRASLQMTWQATQKKVLKPLFTRQSEINIVN